MGPAVVAVGFLDIRFERVAPDDVFLFFLTSRRSLRCRVRSSGITPPQPTTVSLTLPSGNHTRPSVADVVSPPLRDNNNNHRRVVYNIMYVHTHHVRLA